MESETVLIKLHIRTYMYELYMFKVHLANEEHFFDLSCDIFVYINEQKHLADLKMFSFRKALSEIGDVKFKIMTIKYEDHGHFLMLVAMDTI